MKKMWGEEANKVDNRTIWIPEIYGNPNNNESNNDYCFLNSDYIVITPMTIDENNKMVLEKMKKMESQISPIH